VAKLVPHAIDLGQHDVVGLLEERGKLKLDDRVKTYLPDAPMSEPDLSLEEWKRRMDPKDGMTTAQMLEYLRGLGNP
jgi:CubicO group peptidase (beta-lactamase class C family)